MRRVKGFRVLWVLLLFLLVGRLYYIQVLCSPELTVVARGQQMVPVLQENSKGTIYDRNMNVLTGCEKAYYYLIHKDQLKEDTINLLQQMNAEPAGRRGQDYLVFRTTNYSPHRSHLLQEKGSAYSFCVNVRCGETQTAAYLITDLDEMYSELLTGSSPAFYFQGNGAGELIRGTGMIKGNVSGNGEKEATALVTTLDVELQKSIETLLEEEKMKGSVVVTDTATGHILAMASRTEKTDSNETQLNLAVEQSYRLGETYNLIRQIADILDIKTKETAELLGLGTKVFDCYPEESAGKVTAGKKTTATAIQMNRILLTLANEGNQVPPALVMSIAKEESVPCMKLTGKKAEKLRKLQSGLSQKPFTGDGWALGYEGTYAVAIYAEKGNPEKIFQRIEKFL